MGVAALCSSTSAKETLVKDVAEFDAAVESAQPDDHIILADGEWRDADLVFRGEGSKDYPIVLRAQTPGKVVLLGTSRLRFGGEYLTARDLLWRDTAAKDDAVCFRYDSKNLASHCTLEECAIIGDVPNQERKFVSLYGEENRVLSCRFEGKQSKGTLLVVWLGKDARANYHRIETNFFGPREKLGKNGGEIIRIGDSDTSLQESATFVGFNHFYHCDGEAEIISNKSCKNEYVSNMFVGCSGALTLRHGHGARVFNNMFYGEGRKGTGGVRVIGEKHFVAHNRFYELTGDDTRAAISVMNGIADTPLNGYSPVRNVEISGNRFFHCKETFVIGNADDDQPKQTVPPAFLKLSENQVETDGRPVFVVRTKPTELASDRNEFAGGPLGLDDAIGWNESKKPLNEASVALNNCMPLSTGPEWMRTGEELLPEVVKQAMTKEAKY